MLSRRGSDKEDTIVWYVTPCILVDGHKRFEGRLVVCCVTTRLYCVTPQTVLPPRLKMYEIYSKFLKQLLTYGVTYFLFVSSSDNED